MRVVTIVGARPQFVKAAALSRVLRRAHTEVLVHTGQHYDHAMSQVFFDELGIEPPEINLGVGSGRHGEQTGAMLAGLERVLDEQRPDWVLVYGDTNSTLAAGLAASKLGLPVAHVEAGLRSFNRAMPEEINRVLVDHLSTMLLCPSQTAVENLAAEGIRQGIHVVGDVMLDALLHARDCAAVRSDVLPRLGVRAGAYVVATVHRAENTDEPARLFDILKALGASDVPVVFPVHPRTRQVLERTSYALPASMRLSMPLGYLDMVALVASARAVVTDSGGLQKEAYWLGVPCITVRTETEWVETVHAGWNRVVGTDAGAIASALAAVERPAARPPLYGEPGAAERCVRVLEAAAA